MGSESSFTRSKSNPFKSIAARAISLSASALAKSAAGPASPKAARWTDRTFSRLFAHASAVSRSCTRLANARFKCRAHRPLIEPIDLLLRHLRHPPPHARGIRRIRRERMRRIVDRQLLRRDRHEGLLLHRRRQAELERAVQKIVHQLAA